MGSTATTARSRARGYCPVNASVPCFSRTREEPRRHRVLVRRGGAPRCHFSFSVFRRRLQLWGRPRRQPDRAHAGIPSALSISSPFLVRARGPPAVSGFAPGAPASSYGVASARADRNRWPRRASLRRVFTLDFQPGISGSRSRTLSLGEGGRRIRRSAPRRFSFSTIRRRPALALALSAAG